MKKIKIPVQPEVTEISPGHYTVDKTELDQYHKDMEAAYKDFTQAMQGAENDPDELTRRLMRMF